MGVFLNDWAQSGIDGMKDAFRIDDSDLDGAEVLLANYDGGGYDGWAFVLFRKEGHLYEVRGSHCSCYGLEGQWEPEETSVDALKHFSANDGYELRGCHAELGAVLERLESNPNCKR